MALPDCTEAELQAIYEWVDSVPLSRPKRNIARDFADGVLMAELVHHYFPRLVELHNYSPAHNSVQKAYNWSTLNQKVFKRLGLALSRDQCNAVANADAGAIERTLKAVRAGMARFQEGAVARSCSGGSPGASHGAAAASTSQPASPAYAHAGYPAAGGAAAAADSIAALRIAADVPAKHAQQGGGAAVAVAAGAGRAPAASKAAAAAAAAAAGYPTLDYAVAASLEAKECQLEELRETNEILETKISKLEQLVRLKDAKIQALLARLQAPQGGGGEGGAL